MLLESTWLGPIDMISNERSQRLKTMLCRPVSIKFESWQSWTPISGHDGMTDQIDPPTSSNQKKQIKYMI